MNILLLPTSLPLLCVNTSLMTMNYRECSQPSILVLQSKTIYLGLHTYLELLAELILLYHSFEETLVNVHKLSKLNATRQLFATYVNILQLFSQTNIHQLEMIQRKAARFVFKNYSRYSSVTKC